MGQRFKSVYFADAPKSNGQGALTLAFNARDETLYEHIRALSSQEIREHLGHLTHREVVAAAQAENLAINTYCVRMLRQVYQHISLEKHPRDRSAPAIGKDPIISGVSATFRGGRSEPLHDWFPYLEGYSPGFVEQAIREFAPTATRVLDPFGGLGTTPLTAAAMGCDSFYCELNPVLQFVTTAKIEVLTLDISERRRLAKLVRELSAEVSIRIQGCTPDVQLSDCYREVFGDSKFFAEPVYLDILRARSAIDLLSCSSPLVSRLLTVAVLATLVPSSLTIRRGDLRFKTAGELLGRTAAFCEILKGRLLRIADDLEALIEIKKSPTLVAEDARKLASLTPLDADVVVTSPPYLNGTNYFRNTKIELWFLRCLRSREDLADFRLRAVTAGINDVTKAKLKDSVPRQAQDVVTRLVADAYDRRIPRMVSAYFLEMQGIFSAVRKHLVPNSTLLLDIGDSAYGKIHVATDRVLSEILQELGFSLRREVVLRKRLSRSGVSLSQVLLVFHLKGAGRSIRTNACGDLSREWRKPWRNFKVKLPHQAAEYSKRNWGNPLHSLCSYQGKMKPSLAFHLIKTFVPFGGKMLDPFGGVGTIAFEGALAGRKTWSFDISPAAHVIAAAKLGMPNLDEVEKVLKDLDTFIQKKTVSDAEFSAATEIRFNGALSNYFAPRTFLEILLARRFFAQKVTRSESELLVMACLLHILHGNRPYALSRRSHPITPFAPTGSLDYRALMPRLREKVARSLAVPRAELFEPGRALFQDATSWWPREVKDLDAIVTSPPFFDSTRFYLANWMRLWFCGWELDDFRKKPSTFVDERQKRGFHIYEPIFRQSRERLKTGGVLVMHLGKSAKCDMLTELTKVARRWFAIVDSYVEDVQHCESHGIRDKGSVSEHQYLILQ